MAARLILVVTLYVTEGEEAAFDEYEAMAARAVSAAGGLITRAIRVSARAAGPAAPYEIHVVEWPSAAAYAAYRTAARPPELAALRARAICRTEVHEGHDVPVPGTLS